MVLQLIRHPDCHALVCRQVADTLRDSVYAQILWAIDKLGLTAHFRCTQSPLQLYLPATGQRILFRGLDDPQKIKSIKLPFGYIGRWLWFEEADQIQRAARTRCETSSSPPCAARVWPDLYQLQPAVCIQKLGQQVRNGNAPGKRVHHSSYLEARPNG